MLSTDKKVFWKVKLMKTSAPLCKPLDICKCNIRSLIGRLEHKELYFEFCFSCLMDFQSKFDDLTDA